MLFNKIVDLYDWWFYKFLYRSFLDVKCVFFFGNRKFLFDSIVMDFEWKKEMVFVVNIGVIIGLELKLVVILLLFNEMNRKIWFLL